MSVYTQVTASALDAFLAPYPLGRPLSLQGICAGVDNSNFFLETETGSYVLTIFERIGADELPYFLELTDWLAARGIPCPRPIHDREGRALQTLCGKPAAIVQRLPGRSVEGRPASPDELAGVGELLARLHLAGQGFPNQRPNPAGPHWWSETARRLEGRLTHDDWALLHDELDFQRGDRCAQLPSGVIHADLFPDNALFSGERLTGVIDFYYACDDLWLYDLAIVANAWCSREDGSLDLPCVYALWRAYVHTRPLAEGEEAHWFTLLRAGALRFWLLRLEAMHFPRPGDLTQIKDPNEYRRILLARREGY